MLLKCFWCHASTEVGIKAAILQEFKTQQAVLYKKEAEQSQPIPEKQTIQDAGGFSDAAMLGYVPRWASTFASKHDVSGTTCCPTKGAAVSGRRWYPTCTDSKVYCWRAAKLPSISSQWHKLCFKPENHH